jgi:hypothetical protein
MEMPDTDVVSTLALARGQESYRPETGRSVEFWEAIAVMSRFMLEL